MSNAGHSQTTATSAFWNSKVGHAALASMGAMALMIALSTQLQPGPAHAAPHATMPSDTAPMMELA